MAASRVESPSARLRQAFAGVLDGLRAVRHRDRRRLQVATGYRWACSLDLEAEADGAARERRWDYLVLIAEQRERTFGVEVHPATASEVRTVIEKRDAAIRTLERRGLRGFVQRGDWCWIASGKVYLRPTDGESRRLAEAGIRAPVRTLRLPPER
ncbi:MAG: hypothetical protein N2653_11235 [Burkholderiales bacterium]|nr:hypothetical protein [Burkholderiales bacterium]